MLSYLWLSRDLRVESGSVSYRINKVHQCCIILKTKLSVGLPINSCQIKPIIELVAKGRWCILLPSLWHLISVPAVSLPQLPDVFHCSCLKYYLKNKGKMTKPCTRGLIPWKLWPLDPPVLCSYTATKQQALRAIQVNLNSLHRQQNMTTSRDRIKWVYMLQFRSMSNQDGQLSFSKALGCTVQGPLVVRNFLPPAFATLD